MSEERRDAKRDGTPRDEEIQGIARRLFRPAWIMDSPSLWPAIQRAMAEPDGERRAPVSGVFGPAQRVWRWAAAAIAIAAASVGLAVFGLRSRIDRPNPATPSVLTTAAAGPRVEILSSVLEGSPAKAYVFQTKEASFVWLAPAVDARREK